MAKRKPDANPSTPPPEAAAYTVLARRYRPQQFADLVGQEAVAQALTNALQSDRVAHAYLFAGSRGVGKTSTARILAKALNCEKGPTVAPCDICEICRSIATGEDVDVLELDGASNRGIDEVREIRQNVQYRPARARFKIYIIDEVHQLTKDAFNALLKTLEEPPPHVKFIFATTEAHKIPVTILSRCQRFDFAGIGTPRIVERLREIVAGEGLQADDDALEMVARRAGGSMRDAQSLLDQLLAFGGERLTADQVHRLLGTARDDRVADLAAAVLARDAKKALEVLASMADEGLQLGELADQLIEYWRDLMVLSCAGGEEAAAGMVNPAHRQALARQAAAVKLDTILAGLDVLVTTKARLRTSSHDRVLLEMALVRLSRLDDLVSLGQLAQWLRNPPAARPAESATSRPGLPTARLADLAAESAKKKASGVDGSTPLVLTPQTLPAVWERLLGQVGPMLAADLGRGVPAISAPITLAIRFPPRYNLQQEQCQAPDRLAHVEGALANLTGQAWKVRVEAGGPEGVAAPSAPEAGPQPVRPRRPRSEAAQALLRRAEEVLEARVVREDDDFGAGPAGGQTAPAGVPEAADEEE
jgi:DNA polymerase-3 subunit gamma/tau